MARMDTPPARSWAQIWRSPAFVEGVKDLAPPSLGILAWGFIAGIAMIKTGMGLEMAILMNVMVYAGSAQLAVVPLISADAPMWVIWAAAFCVNLRFVIFSVGLRHYFGHLPLAKRLGLAFFSADMNYVTLTRRFPVDPSGKALSDAERGDVVAYYLGGTAITMVAWHVSSTAGMVLGNSIPPSWGLAFAGTLALVGLAGTLIVDRLTVVTAVVAACAAIAAWALPLKLNIVVAIAAAVAVGALLDQFKRGAR